VTTAVVSDLHLGHTGSLLGTPHARSRLMAQVGEADRVVLLGDVVGLREGPVHEMVERARPFFAELARAQRGGRVVIVPGNHDHGLVRPLLEQRRLDAGEDGSLQTVWPIERATPGLAGEIAAAMDGVELALAYPGVWLRSDVYATHGHYLDCHMTFPRPESLAAGLMQGLTRPLPQGTLTPDDYEAVLAPLYALADGGTLVAARRRVAREGWRRLKGRSGSWGWRVAGGAAFGALAAANRVGLERFKADLSPEELDRAGIRAMHEVVDRLVIDAEHVIFGHTHSAGLTPVNGRLLVNTGSWVYSPGLIDVGGYWPGTCGLVGETGAPELRGLLDGLR
jgi:predicted phosphodiesterase